MINQNTVDYTSVKQLFDDAKEDFEQKEYDRALKKFDQLIDYNLKTFHFVNQQNQVVLSGVTVYTKALTHIGYILYLEGNPKAGITYFERLLKEFPAGPFGGEFWAYKANIHKALKDYASELLCIDKVLAFESSNINAIKRKGSCLILLHSDFTQALSYFRSATNIAPNDEEAWALRADAHLSLNQLAKAEKCLLKALTINPKYTEAFYVLGWVYTQQENYLKALECLNKVLELDPKHTQAFATKGDLIFKQGSTLLEQKEYIKALNCFIAIFRNDAYQLNILISPIVESLGGLINTGMNLVEQKSFKKAEEYYQQTLVFIDEFSTKFTGMDKFKCQTFYNLSLLYFHQSRLSESLDYFDRALALFNPAGELTFSLIQLWWNKSIVFKLLNNVEKQLECLNKVLELNPKHKQALESKGEILLKQGDYQQGFRLFLQGIELDVDQERLNQRKSALFKQMFSQAEDFNKMQKPAEADCYQLLVELAGDNASLSVLKKSALHNLGQYWRKNNEASKAEEYYKKALSIDFAFRPTWQALFVLYKTVDNHEEALNCLNQLIKINPKHTAAFFEKGLIYQQQEKYLETLQMYEQCLQIDQFLPTEEFWLQKSIVHGKLGQNEQQRICAQKLAQIHPNHPFLKELQAKIDDELMSQAILFQAQSNYDEAIECFKKISENYTDYKLVGLKLGLCFKAKGMLKEAYQHFDQLIRKFPRYEAPQEELGLVLVEQGDYKKAQTWFERKLKLFPNCFWAKSGLITVLKKSLEQDPLKVELRRQLYFALIQSGLYEDATNFLTESKQLLPNESVWEEDEKTFIEKMTAFKQMAQEICQIFTEPNKSTQMEIDGTTVNFLYGQALKAEKQNNLIQAIICLNVYLLARSDDNFTQEKKEKLLTKIAANLTWKGRTLLSEQAVEFRKQEKYIEALTCLELLLACKELNDDESLQSDHTFLLKLIEKNEKQKGKVAFLKKTEMESEETAKKIEAAFSKPKTNIVPTSALKHVVAPLQSYPASTKKSSIKEDAKTSVSNCNNDEDDTQRKGMQKK